MVITQEPPPDAVATRTARHWLGADGIVREWDLPGLEQNLADAKENILVTTQIAAGSRRPLLVDMSEVKAISRDARVYYASEEVGKVISAVALLVASPLSRAIGNFFLGFNKAAVPIRLFGNEPDALIWLKEFLP